MLITVCGLPCSGKSTRARALAAQFRELDASKEVVVIDDDSLGIAPAEYEERDDEKRGRAKQLSAVRRHLGKQTIVVLDSLAYIKGFRYQLYCDAKQAGVPSCVVHVATPQAECELRNARVGKWPPKLLQALCLRFEEPNGMNRWDAPLFLDVLGEEPASAAQIANEAAVGGAPRANAATFKPPAAAPDYVAAVAAETNRVVKEALQLHQTSAGQRVLLAGVPVALPLELGMPQLSRIRRNFMQLATKRVVDEDKIAPFFAEFLDQQWRDTF